MEWAMATTPQILDLISDVRTTRQFKAADDTGMLREVTIVEFPSADDFVRQSVRNLVAEKVIGERYVSVMEYSAVTSLIQSRVPVVRR
jgi:hypothetical protein